MSVFLDSNIHILGISESWLSYAIPDKLVDINGYTLYRQDTIFLIPGTSQVKKGGGICLYIHNNIPGNVCKLDNLNICNENIECQWIIIKSPN